MGTFFRNVADRIPIPDGVVAGCNWLRSNYRGCFISVAILLGISALVWARGDISPPRIAFAHADAKAMAQGIFGGMKDKLGEMARGIEAALAENAKTNAEVNAVKGRVTKIEQAPTMTADDLEREIKKLMDTIQLKIDQKVPMSEYQNDRKLLDQKVSMLQSVINSVVGTANAQPAPPAPVAPAAAPATPPAKTAKLAEAPGTAPIDYTRLNELVDENPRAMAGYEAYKDDWAIRYSKMSQEDFEAARQRIRIREAGLNRPPKTSRDLANYEKERRAAISKVPKCDIGAFSKEKGKCV